MTKYKLKAQDEKIIEFISKKILPIANDVTNFYSHWTTSDEEGDLQKAFLYECRQEGINLTREVAITQYYKDLAFREKEVDFFIFPKQSTTTLPSGIFIETKSDYDDITGQTNTSGRYQLFRYIYSSGFNPDENLRDAEYGVFLQWGQNYDGAQFKNLDTFSIVENEVEAYIEIWKATDGTKTNFAKIYQSKEVVISISSLGKDDLLKLCHEKGIDAKAGENKKELVSKLNNAGVYNLGD